MSIEKLLKIILVAASLTAVCGVAVAKGEPVLARINKLKSSIIEAHSDSKITKVERDLLMSEWKSLSKLYSSYYQDKTLSVKEKKILDSRIKKFDVNLFRKKYD
ncbi:MAG: hypothetical protein CSB47_06605 [Proteobacteria bacterium]|nr:MAG: hypothetical protein CSB47_06605 [Pseudomonadota bacterium]